MDGSEYSTTTTTTNTSEPTREEQEEEETTDDEDENIEDQYKEGISFQQNLFRALSKVKRPGTFFCGGVLNNAPLLGIKVENGENPLKLSFPFYEDIATSLKQVCEIAEFGIKDKTVIDLNVRNTLQLPPEKFTITNEKWNEYLRTTILPSVMTGLGIQNAISASLYKLLLYEKGSFFKIHRDTEKEDRMFGTLIIQLPSCYEGGELVVKHKRKSHTFDFSSKVDPQNEFNCHFAAFFCDCQHEVLPVISGNRLCLVYNLIYTGQGALPTMEDNRPAIKRISKSLNYWFSSNQNSKPKKLVFLLEHMYSEAGLSYSDLKGTDLAAANVLMEAIKNRPFRACLGLIQLRYSGTLQGYNEDDEEVEEQTLTAENLVPLKFDFEEEDEKELEDLENMEGEDVEEDEMNNDLKEKGFLVEEDIDRHTGNAGTTFDRWYQQAALIVWPTQSAFESLSPSSPILPFLRKVNLLVSNPKIYSELLTLGEIFEHDSVLEIIDQIIHLENKQLNKAVIRAIFGLYRDPERGQYLIHLSTLIGWPSIFEFLKNSVGSFELLAQIYAEESVCNNIDNKNIFLSILKLQIKSISTLKHDIQAHIALVNLFIKLKIPELLEEYIDLIIKSYDLTTQSKLFQDLGRSILDSKTPKFDAIQKLANSVHSAYSMIANKQPPSFSLDVTLSCTCEKYCRKITGFLQSEQLRFALPVMSVDKNHVILELNKTNHKFTTQVLKTTKPYSLEITKDTTLSSLRDKYNRDKMDLGAIKLLMKNLQIEISNNNNNNNDNNNNNVSVEISGSEKRKLNESQESSEPKQKKSNVIEID